MNIIVGASGQVGSNIVREIKSMNLPVQAVVRNADKLRDKSIKSRVADLFDLKQLIYAFEGGETAFLITPENPASTDIVGDTKRIVENYRKAVQATGIKKIVGLSCVGAHINGKMGNIIMSRILEQAFVDVDVEKIFIRPSYYYSNWMPYLETIDQYGVLPTFFPKDLKLDMISPVEVAKFTAKIMTDTSAFDSTTVFELAGPRKYSSTDVAQTFSKILNKNVSTQPIPREEWDGTLLSAGFTENMAANLADMTQAVIDGTAVPEKPNEMIKLETTLDRYLEEVLIK